jgi:hypothetical protein
VPIVVTHDASDVLVNGANLQGEVTFMGGESSLNVLFEYGTTTGYGYTTALKSMAAIGLYNVTATGLRRNTTYHYRAIASWGEFAVSGDDKTFTTLSMEGATTELTILSAGVFADYYTSGDVMVAVEGFVTYPPYYPSSSVGEYFHVQLIGLDNSTVIASVPLSNWGDRPTAIYMKPTLAGNLTTQAAYQIKIIGVNVTGYPNTTYTLTAGDWKGSDKTKLDEWCRGVAISMAAADNVSAPTYLQVLTDRREVISDAAGGYFTMGIPGISQVRPYLFATHIIQPTVVTASGSSIYTNATAWETFVGAQAAADITAFGLPFGLSGRNAAAGMIFLIIIGVMLIIVKGTGGFGALGAFFIAIPVLWLGTYWQINEVQLLGVIVILCAAAFLASYIIPRL